MLSSLNSLSTLPSYLSTQTGNAPVMQTANASLIQSAVDLSANADMIATLGNSGMPLPIYNASGLLDSFVNAGTAPSPIPVPNPGTDTQSLGQQLLDQAVIGNLSADPILSGVYTASGSIQGSSPDANANWASALQTNPNLAAVVAADSVSQGVVGNLLGIA